MDVMLHRENMGTAASAKHGMTATMDMMLHREDGRKSNAQNNYQGSDSHVEGQNLFRRYNMAGGGPSDGPPRPQGGEQIGNEAVYMDGLGHSLLREDVDDS